MTFLTTSHSPPHHSHEQGYVLFMALIFLIAISVLGVLVVQSNSSQEVMSRGYRDLGIAFTQAEQRVQDAEVGIDVEDLSLATTDCLTIDSELWAVEQQDPTSRVDRLDLCDGSSSLSMGRSSTQQVDQKYRILTTDFDDPDRPGSQVVIETIFIP